MRAIMAVSRDGYLARGPRDDMSWTGKADKAIFRLLTTLGGGQLGAGSRTYDAMPSPSLHGRQIHRLSRKPRSLDGRTLDLNWFQLAHPNGWLIGGREIVLEALETGLLTEMVMCHLDRMAFPPPGIGLKDEVGTYILGMSTWHLANEIPVADVLVRVYRRG